MGHERKELIRPLGPNYVAIRNFEKTFIKYWVRLVFAASAKISTRTEGCPPRTDGPSFIPPMTGDWRQKGRIVGSTGDGEDTYVRDVH